MCAHGNEHALDRKIGELHAIAVVSESMQRAKGGRLIFISHGV